MKGGVVISMVVVLAMMMMVVKPSEAVVSCADMASSVVPCVAYLTGGGDPSVACCAGVKKITAIAQSSDDKKQACECLKTAASHMANIKEDAASSLPPKCGVPFNIPISQNTNSSSDDNDRREPVKSVALVV